ncbi:hypothetical protein SAMN02745194_00488 [Roseomonas rosea]|uniref:Uncharacterized protein n=1 Tax=Muricoccus roseus TaxID=198092 RepID=A0A1M6BG44_9PROT|nr:hypothetical protein [Roseomonas rosea]SHI47714.1 hypothetical protein SAMN02745194_00488 [Roseomonas rosea]
MTLPISLTRRIADLEAEAARLADQPAGSTVQMMMATGGLLMEIPASIAAEAMRNALSGVAELPSEALMLRLGVVPVFNMVPIPGDDLGACTLELDENELAPLRPML